MFAFLFQIPIGPEVFVILLVFLILVGVPLGIAVIVFVGYRRRQATDEADSADRIEELEQRVDELEGE